MAKSTQSEVNISRVGSRNSGDDRSLDTYLREIRTIPVLNLQEEMALARDARNGVNGAINKLIQANLRFVVVVARQYQNQGLPLSDLINEGNIGLIKAAQRYDEHKGFKFISYAVWWVRQAIMQALAEQSRIFRLPLNRAEELRRINKVVRGLKQELGREPTTHEIAGKLSLDHRDVVDIMRTFSPHLSLDAPFSPGEEGRLLDVIEDTTIESPDAPVMEKSLKEQVVWALNTLTDREAAVIRSYFGINREKPMTLDEIGKQFGLTRERVRQIKERAIRRLRHTSRSVRLHAYMS
ncbi:MAG: RNA polymerase sigma factor RpoD/SigA [Gemmatimonadetes bacterium]|nr:RNA polymerase sigma factor RpoD/SigA [Gemmatimonadota bacterium]MYH17669.1 RNA polymerase sigma factor RpoD/SigA [Gemmatimonadota bacterium]MYK99340.1 RNA polymerase sigma factor RpoD/SigA [Gemmatimonadota bacterium]